MKQSEGRKGGTLFSRMLAFLLVVLVLQALIFLAVLLGGGILDETRANSLYVLSERTANRKLDLENDMVQRWSNLAEGKDNFFTAVSGVLEKQGADIEDLSGNRELCQQVLTAAATDLVDMLRRNGVTGAFAVLDCPGDDGYPGVYIRDYDPRSYSADNTDLLLERGLPEVARGLSIPMDSYWSALFRFDLQGADYDDFFTCPMEAALSVPAAERQEDYFYHWSAAFSLSEADRPVVAYSIPLVWKDGTVFGVLGVDLTVDYLAEQLTFDELGEDQTGSYLLGVTENGGESYRTICASGPNFRAYFGRAEELAVTPDELPGIVTLRENQRGRGDLYGAVWPLKLYNSNTPFEHEQWALIGILSGEHLFSFANRVQMMLLASLGITLLLGLGIVFMATRSFARPISQLMGDLRRSDPNRPIRLRRVQIAELDALSVSIEDLSDAAAESASRISKIIAMSHIPIGVFEYRKKANKVFCSKNLFELLDWPERPEEDRFLPEEEFLCRLNHFTDWRQGDESERIFRLSCGDGDRWVQLFYRDEGENALGAFLDVTEDMESKQKIEYERDFDILTNLHNRRAFDRQAQACFDSREEAPLKKAAVIMLDLDNLKYINDSYGHDYGDRYIQAFAHCLEYFSASGGLVGRRSGDEFNVFLYGYDSEEEVRGITAAFWARLGETAIELPNGTWMRVRASGGISWYPRDADEYGELLRLADFAMYRVKHTDKGGLREFDRADYDQKSILISGQDAMNRTLENHLVRYALQPIVSAVDGSIYGYEFLMRPEMEELANLSDLFRLAKAQSKLQQIEKMTWEVAMGVFARLARSGKLAPGTRAFINSVGNQLLSGENIAALEKLYPELLDRVVLEITETEESNGEISAMKKERIASWGGLLALDDYGSGYNSEALLMNTSPDLVKVDINIIRSIDSDGDKRALLRNLVGYAKCRGILVLAEGVESGEELETVVSCGVDYLQGFYLGRPDFTPQKLSQAVANEIRVLHDTYFPT